jgi:putative cell wall-binding protein
MKVLARRSAAALLAGSVVVAGTLAGIGSAAAFSVTSVASVSGGSNELLSAGVAAQPIGGLTIAFADNGTSHVWSVGDTITVQLWDATANAPLSNTTANTFQSASFSALPSLSVTNSVNSTYYTLALAKGPTSSVNDEFVLTFAKDAPLDTNTTKFSFSNVKVTLGSRVAAGHQLQFKLTASNGTPFTGASSSASVGIGIVPATTMTVSSRATGGPSTAGVSLGTVTVKDITGAAVNNGDEIDLTLTGGFFSSAGTAGGTLPTSTTPTIVTVTKTSDTVKVTAKKTSSVGDTLTLSGAKIVLPAAAGEVYLVATDKTTSTIIGAVGVATVVSQTRVGGTDRYATAAALFDLRFSGATSVVLTSGANYPDALSAIYLAGQLSTGVLTTDPNTLPASTRGELLTRGIKTVYIVGGPKAVSDQVAAQIAAMHVSNNSSSPLIAVVRIAGADRYETNQRVDTRSPAGATTAIVATGENFADALAVGPAVYKTGYPLILTPGQSLSSSAKATIQALGITHVVIAGGTSAVSAAVESALVAAGVTVDYRIAGADRTDTAGQVAAWETTGLAGYDIYPALGSLGLTGTGTINVARGDNFADALAAGSVAGFDESVIVLTADPSTLGAGIPAYFTGRAGQATTLRALGQTSALSATTMNAAAASLTQPLKLS